MMPTRFYLLDEQDMWHPFVPKLEIDGSWERTTGARPIRAYANPGDIMNETDVYTPAAPAPADSIEFQYLIRDVTGDEYSRNRPFVSDTWWGGFTWAETVDEAVLYATPSRAQHAIDARNTKYQYAKDVFIVVPVKITTSSKMVLTPVTTYINTPVTTTTRELA